MNIFNLDEEPISQFKINKEKKIATNKAIFLSCLSLLLTFVSFAMLKINHLISLDNNMLLILLLTFYSIAIFGEFMALKAPWMTINYSIFIIICMNITYNGFNISYMLPMFFGVLFQAWASLYHLINSVDLHPKKSYSLIKNLLTYSKMYNDKSIDLYLKRLGADGRHLTYSEYLLIKDRVECLRVKHSKALTDKDAEKSEIEIYGQKITQ